MSVCGGGGGKINRKRNKTHSHLFWKCQNFIFPFPKFVFTTLPSIFQVRGTTFNRSPRTPTQSLQETWIIDTLANYSSLKRGTSS